MKIKLQKSLAALSLKSKSTILAANAYDDNQGNIENIINDDIYCRTKGESINLQKTTREKGEINYTYNEYNYDNENVDLEEEGKIGSINIDNNIIAIDSDDEGNKVSKTTGRVSKNQIK